MLTIEKKLEVYAIYLFVIQFITITFWRTCEKKKRKNVLKVYFRIKMLNYD